MTYANLKISAIQREQHFFLYQLIAVAVVAVAAVGVWVIGLLFPNFFVYPYFKWGGWEAVWKFWPLFAWGVGLNLILMLLDPSKLPIHTNENRELLGWKLATSTLAGIWEELGYRWAFICYAMIGIAVVNWVFGAGLGWVLVIALVIGTVVLWSEKEKGLAILTLGGAALAVLFALYANPVYWFYQLLVWVIHFTTLTLMDPVLYGEHQTLLIFGAVVANSWFRDGHKYQGPFGLVNSWYVGMVLLYATIIYGLWTAILVHALYNIIINVLRFALQKIR